MLLAPLAKRLQSGSINSLLGSPGAAISDDLLADDELDHDKTSMGNRDAQPENNESLGDQVTSGDGETTSPDEFQQLLDGGDFGEIIDLEKQYQVVQELGAGGQGTVLKAIDKRLDRTVALKFLLEEFGQSTQALGRFLTEAKAIATLNHHNIVQIFGLERSARGPFIVMEYIEGGSLGELLKSGPLELERAVDIICQVCDGLGVAHDQGIVHRDIKPANILMTTAGLPKLSDFGLARQVSIDHGQTQEGAVLGTSDFMSREQHNDATSVDARSDLWSLAATLYQMLAGKSPRRMRLDQLPAAIRDVLDKALEENPEDRYQTVDEFRNAIRASITGPTESQTTDTAVDGDELLERNACPGCSATNTAAAKFCRTCGAALEVACPGCETMNSIHSKFCLDCGADMSLPRLEGHDTAAHINSGNAYYKLGQYDKAIAEYTEAIRLDPDDALAYSNRGLAYSKKGEPDKAIADYTDAIRINPDYALAYINRGWAYSNQEEYDKAIADYSKSIDLDPDDALAYINRGVAYNELGQYDKALSDYTDAIRIDPGYAEPYYGRGVAYSKKDEPNTAIVEYNEAIRIKPDFANAYNNRGNAYDELGQYDKAIADYTEAIRIKPDDVEAWLNRGMSYTALGHHEQAIADYTEAIRINPDFALAYLNRSLAYNYLGQYDKAITDFTAAIRIDPDDAEAYYNRAITHQENGDEDKADADFAKAKELGYEP